MRISGAGETPTWGVALSSERPKEPVREDRFVACAAKSKAPRPADPVALMLELAVLKPTSLVAEEIVLSSELVDFLDSRGASPADFGSLPPRDQVKWLRRFVTHHLASHDANDPLVRSLQRALARQWLHSEMAQSQVPPEIRERLSRSPWQETIAELRTRVVRHLDLLSNAGTLAPKQRASLARSLKAHGLSETSTAHGYQKLRRVSQHNLQRLRASDRLDVPASVRARIDRATEQLSFLYTHNTRDLDALPQTPLMSSRHIETMSDVGGANSQVFNQRFLSSDDNVFFRVAFGHREREPDFDRSEYGDTALSARPGFLRRFGWISAFVMYPQDLQNAGAALQVEEVAHAKAFDPAHHAPGGVWRAARQQLHRLDFTVSDFEELITSRLRAALAALHRADPERFEEALAILDSGSVAGIQSLMERLILVPMSLPRYWELKVPVAVPPSQLVIHSSS